MESGYRKCPYCGEEVKIGAKKCKHCGEWLSVEAQKAAEQKEQAKREAEKAEARQQQAKEERKGLMALMGCGLVFLGVLIGGVLLLLHFTIPSDERMENAIVEDMQTCVADKTQAYSGFLGQEASALVSLLFDTGVPAQEIIGQFYKNNRITIEQKWLWSVGRIHNRNTAREGTNVCFGILGMVFPSVAWEDFVLLDEDSKNELTN